MFIMPGIESAAPDRTETSSGLAGSPKLRAVFLLHDGLMAASTWAP